MSETKQLIIVILSSVLLISSLVSMSLGFRHQQGAYSPACDRVYNFHYVFPLYKVGCWLGQEKK
jgi:hypothetical protein